MLGVGDEGGIVSLGVEDLRQGGLVFRDALPAGGKKVSPFWGTQFLKGQVLMPVWIARRAGMVGMDSG